MEDTIFMKIVRGEIPCEKVYEDDLTLAFMDLHPIVPGHVLVIPKVPVDKFYELSDEYYVAVWKTVKKVAKRIEEVTGSKRVCMRAEGFDVAHAHIHIYPCNNSEDFYGDKDRLGREPDHSGLKEMAAKLAFS